MKILLAEDDKNFGTVLKGELEQDGNTVDIACDGVEAVMNFIDRPDYDFIILDIKMPRLDGINALRIMKKLNPEVPAITISGNAGSGEMLESVRAGAIRCLTKPFEIAQLKDEMQKYSARHNRGQQ
jgi:two-component system response regulator AtoC